MISTPRIRSAVALAHVMADVHLHLELTNGSVLVVGTHPAADLHPCQMRRVLLAEANGSSIDCSRFIGGVIVGGSLTEIGAGLYRSEAADRLSFATFLSPTSVEQLLTIAARSCPGADTVEASLKPDHCLGVTVVTLHDRRPDNTSRLRELAVRLAGSCATEEALRFLAQPVDPQAPTRSSDAASPGYWHLR